MSTGRWLAAFGWSLLGVAFLWGGYKQWVDIPSLVDPRWAVFLMSLTLVAAGAAFGASIETIRRPGRVRVVGLLAGVIPPAVLVVYFWYFLADLPLPDIVYWNQFVTSDPVWIAASVLTGVFVGSIAGALLTTRRP